MRYALLISSLVSVEFLAASSRISKKNCDHYLKHTAHSPLFILPKATQNLSDDLKIYERLYLIIRFAHKSGSLADVNGDNS